MNQKILLDTEDTGPYEKVSIYSYRTRIKRDSYPVCFELEISEHQLYGYGHVCLTLDFDAVGRVACNELDFSSNRETLDWMWEKLCDHAEFRCFLGADKKIRYWLCAQEVLQILPHDCVHISVSDTTGFESIKIDNDAIDWVDTSQTGPCKQCLPHIERMMNDVLMCCLEVNKEHYFELRKFREGLA